MSPTWTSSAPELLLRLRREDPEPLHRQLEHGLREVVRSGRLPLGSALPSSRALAGELGVSRGIVVEAYEQLVAEGYLATRPGGTTTIACIPNEALARRPLASAASVRHDFRPGRPAVTEFPRAVWLRSVRRVMETAPDDRLGYLDGRGMPELRLALARYLDRVRGTCSDPDDVIVCTGFAQGLGLVARVLLAQGATRIAMEAPTDPDVRAMVEEIGLAIVDVPVDTEGIRVDRLATTEATAVVVTPAHQYPTGAVLTAERRAALVAWATATGGLIIEDDYDAEFRYDREPIGSLQGLVPDHVVYAGSASKILAPGLRLGWLIAPTRIAPTLAAAKKRADQGSSALDQLAFADFLDRGELDRHLRRVRPIYRRRRDLLLAALARHLPELDPCGASAGLHVLTWLPDGLDETAVVEAATAAGIGLAGVHVRPAPYPVIRTPRPGGPEERGGLIFGYGQVEERDIEAGVVALARVLAEVRAGVSSSAAP
ncbi:MAG: PLP-dependent aminotransferase family protein [Chloroflexi bacterium]|nr:PLP-dependent aminotransferase family protein [Chloroflexota bacterium]